MAGIEPITLPVSLEMTETGKALIANIIAEVLLNDLRKGDASDIRSFIRSEMRRALADITAELRRGIHHE